MKRNVTVNEYSVRIDNYDSEGNPTTSEIFYDGGDYEWITNTLISTCIMKRL